MRDLHVDAITDVISKLCIEANINLNKDIKNECQRIQHTAEQRQSFYSIYAQ